MEMLIFLPHDKRSTASPEKQKVLFLNTTFFQTSRHLTYLSLIKLELVYQYCNLHSFFTRILFFGPGEAGYSYFLADCSLKIFLRIFLVSEISVTWNFRF